MTEKSRENVRDIFLNQEERETILNGLNKMAAQILHIEKVLNKVVEVVLEGHCDEEKKEWKSNT